MSSPVVIALGAPLIDVKAVCTRIGVSRTTIYKWMREGSFPKGHGMSARCRRWEPDEVEAWIRTRAQQVIPADGTRS